MDVDVDQDLFKLLLSDEEPVENGDDSSRQHVDAGMLEQEVDDIGHLQHLGRSDSRVSNKLGENAYAGM